MPKHHSNSPTSSEKKSERTSFTERMSMQWENIKELMIDMRATFYDLVHYYPELQSKKEAREYKQSAYRKLRIEHMEPRQMMSANALAELNPVLPEVPKLASSQAESAYVASIRPEVQMHDLRKDLAASTETIATVSAKLEEARADLVEIQGQTNYERSAFMPRRITERQKPLIEEHGRIVQSMMDKITTIQTLRNKGDNKDANIQKEELQEEMNSYVKRMRGDRSNFVKGKEFLDAGLLMPRTVSGLRDELTRQQNTLERVTQTVANLEGIHTTLSKQIEITKEDLQADTAVQPRLEAEKAIESSLSETIAPTSITNFAPIDAVFEQVGSATLDPTSSPEPIILNDVDLSNKINRIAYNEPIILTPPTDSNVIADEISTAINAVSEDIDTIPYARMEASTNADGMREIATVSIHYSSPNNSTFIEIMTNDGRSRVGSQLISHEGGMKDGYTSINLRYNANLHNAGDLEIRLCDGVTREVLEVVRGSYSANNRTMSFYTENYAWNTVEAGRAVELPITPDLQFIKSEGTNVLVSIQSPHDKSIITFGGEGMFATQTIFHEGGTSLDFARLAFDSSRATGYYTLKLYDRSGGRIIDTMDFHWDKNTKQLQLVNAADKFDAQMSGYEEFVSLETTLFDQINSLQLASVDSPLINNIQRMQLYSTLTGMGEPYASMYIDLVGMEQRMYEKFPLYAPENWEQGIDAQLASMGAGATRGQAETAFHAGRLDLFHRLQEALPAYEQTVSGMIQTALNTIIKIKNGGNQRDLLKAYYDNFQLPTSVTVDLEKLSQGAGITLPSSKLLMQAATQIFQDQWSILYNTQQDLAEYREYQERLLEAGQRQNAYGEWVAIGAYEPAIADSTTTQDMRLALKIRDALNNSNDPRILAYNAATRDSLSILISEHIGDTYASDISGSVLYVLSEIDSIETSGFNFNTDPESVLNFVRLRRQVAERDATEVYNTALNWYNDGNVSAGDDLPIIKGNAIRYDTAAGRIFLGLYQNAFSKTDEAMQLMFVEADRVLGVSAERLFTAARNRNVDEFYMRLIQEYDAAGYAHVFNGTPQSVEENIMLSVRTNSVHYNDYSDHIRVHFDFTGMDFSYHHANIYLVSEHGIVIDAQNALVQNIEGQIYADIPLNSLYTFAGQDRSFTGTYRVKVAVWKDETSTAGFQGEFMSNTFSVDMTIPESESGSGGDVVTTENLSALPEGTEYNERRAIENEILKHVAVPVEHSEEKQWTYRIDSGQHIDENQGIESEFYNIDLNWGSENMDKGEAVFSSAPGIVISTPADSNSVYGTVIIQHTSNIMINGVETEITWFSKYLHMDNITIKKGDFVTQETQIGQVSNVTTPTQSDMKSHLHFEIYYIFDNKECFVSLENWLTNNNISKQ